MRSVLFSLALGCAITSAIGCGTPPSKNNVECKALPTCEAEEAEVESCEGVDGCREVTLCGETIFCAPGGGGGGDILASDYDQSCESAVDCSLMFEGDPCECKVCADGAINRDEVASYEADIAAAMCDPEQACPAIACGEEIRAFCEEGTCVAKPTEYATTDDFDNTCETASDCAQVYEGDVCAECQCPNAVINVNAVDEYNAQFNPDCRLPDPCDCAPAEVVCQNSLCQFAE